MFCKNCGVEIKEGRFCPNCGTEVYEIENKINVEGATPKKVKIKYETEKKDSTKKHKVFANLGMGLGIGAFVSTLMGTVPIDVAIAGLIFSCLGKKSEDYRKNANIGFGLSLASVIIGAILSVIIAIFLLLYIVFWVALTLGLVGSGM